MKRLRALVLSTERSRGALSAVRSLRRSGWTVGVGTPTAHGMLSASRAVSAAHLVPKPRGQARDFVAATNQAIAAGGYDVLFGGTDDFMAALSAYRGDLDAAVAHPDYPAVRSALDKLELTRLAGEVGLSAPRTHAATDDLRRSWRGAVVVKCRSHWTPGRTQAHRIETKLYADMDSAWPRIEHIRAAGEEAIVQEAIDGRLSALIGVYRDGRLDARVQQEASAVWPIPSGVSTRAVTVPVDADLARRSGALLERLGWSGLVELQFLTGADGLPRLIDLNGRFFGSMSLTNAARPGVPDLWGRWTLGGPVDPLSDAPPGHRYTWLAGDLRRATVERRGGLARDLLGTLRWAASATDSVLSVRDLPPALQLVTDRFTREDAVDPGAPAEVRHGTRLAPGCAT